MDVLSPPTTGREGQKSFGTLLPSTSAIPGIKHKLETARSIAKRVAFRTLSLSISPACAEPNPTEAHRSSSVYNLSRLLRDNSFESFIPSGQSFLSKITAAATTGPHSAPLPTSSKPQTRPLNFSSMVKSGMVFISCPRQPQYSLVHD